MRAKLARDASDAPPLPLDVNQSDASDDEESVDAPAAQNDAMDIDAPPLRATLPALTASTDAALGDLVALDDDSEAPAAPAEAVPDRPFACSIANCTRAFKTRSDLTRHVEQTKMHAADAPNKGKMPSSDAQTIQESHAILHPVVKRAADAYRCPAAKCTHASHTKRAYFAHANAHLPAIPEAVVDAFLDTEMTRMKKLQRAAAASHEEEEEESTAEFQAKPAAKPAVDTHCANCGIYCATAAHLLSHRTAKHPVTKRAVVVSIESDADESLDLDDQPLRRGRGLKRARSVDAVDETPIKAMRAAAPAVQAPAMPGQENAIARLLATVAQLYRIGGERRLTPEQRTVFVSQILATMDIAAYLAEDEAPAARK